MKNALFPTEIVNPVHFDPRARTRKTSAADGSLHIASQNLNAYGCRDYMGAGVEELPAALKGNPPAG